MRERAARWRVAAMTIAVWTVGDPSKGLPGYPAKSP
jgi:hypothetical protein